MCQSCGICAQHARQHPREPLQPYPVPTLPWQLVSQDLFALNGRAYLVTVDHYSDFYETDHLPSIQSSAVIQATKQHFSRHGIPRTLITDNGAQYTSDLFKTFAKKYQFNHITSSPYWSQSNGRAEADVKSAKHILLTAEDVDLALLSVRNTPPAGHTYSPAQHLFGRALRSDLPQLPASLEPFTPSRDTVVADHVHHKLQQKNSYDKHASVPNPNLPPGCYVYARSPPTSSAQSWIRGKVVGPAGPRLYLIDTGISQIRRNCVQIQLAPPQLTGDSSPQDQPAPTLPDKLLPNSLSPTAPPYLTPKSSASLSITPPRSSEGSSSVLSPASVTSLSPPADETLPAESPCPPSPFTTSQTTPDSSSPSLPKPPNVTHSGRIIRRPARYSD